MIKGIYIGRGDRQTFDQYYVDPLRDEPCKMVILAFAKDNHNLKGNFSPFALEYSIGEKICPQGFGIAFMARFDKIETAPDEHIPWPDPAENYQLSNDGEPCNEYELNFWVLSDPLLGIIDLEDCDFLRVRVEDQAIDDSCHGNWRRSQDFLQDILAGYKQILGIKAYQEFQDKYVEADYEDGPTFARTPEGGALVNFAVAVEWAIQPPEIIEVIANNEISNEPHLPPGCARSCRFDTYRLEDRTSDKYQKLCELFQLPPGDCLDFYMRGSGLIYEGNPYTALLLLVSDDCLTQEGQCPILYMSHDDHMLLEEDRDDYSVAIACGDDLGEGYLFNYGDSRHGAYDPNGADKLNVISDVKLAGIGMLKLESDNQSFYTAVQSEGDLFVIDAHGGPPHPPNKPFPSFSRFNERGPDGQIIIGNPSCVYRATPYDLTGFTSDTDWLVMLACSQMNQESIPHYYDALISSGRLMSIGGYRNFSVTTVNEQASANFNLILNNFNNYQYYLWTDPPSGGIFIAAWMESHCMLARSNEQLAEEAIRARAIDINYLYYIEKPPVRVIMWFWTTEDTYKIRKVGIN